MPFPSVHSRRRFERRYLPQLVTQGAVIFHRGRKLVDLDRYTEVVMEIARSDSLARVGRAQSIPGPRQQNCDATLFDAARLREWVLRPSAEEAAVRRSRGDVFSMDEIAERFMGVRPDAMARWMRSRLGVALRGLGCVRIERRLMKGGRHVYRVPAPVDADGRASAINLDDPFDDAALSRLREWVLRPTPQEAATRRTAGGFFSLADAAARCLGVDLNTQTQSARTRLGRALGALGCIRIERRFERPRYVYWGPQEAGMSGAASAPGESLSSVGASPTPERGPRPSTGGNVDPSAGVAQ